jgi:hypothetical protein
VTAKHQIAEVQFPARAGVVSLPQRIQNGTGTHNPVGTEGEDFSLTVKRPKREGKQSYSSNIGTEF